MAQPPPLPRQEEDQQRRQLRQEVSHDLAAISLVSRIPAFWRDMPRMWFARFEAVIGPQHQSEAVKFDLVLSKLDKEELSQISDLIDDPPEQQRYTVLKNRLMKIFQESAEAQFHKLVKEMDLGSQRPSQLLAKMRELAKNSGTAGDTLKNLWMTRLPGWVRAILASSSADTKLDDLASMADKIMDNLRSGDIAAVDTPTASTSAVKLELLSQVRDLSMELKALRCEVNSIRGRGRPLQRGNGRWGRSRSRSQSRPRRTPQSPDWLCKHHYRYRGAAWKCEAPCNWVNKPTVQRDNTNSPGN
ncbi:uncharacterized protein LOC126380973 [Pectinophora gossypiella]|uniref:uncharacterized protein LOC126380973 n=1 Tax=Pectinophora gossypiella TaxID=13191 RepID=UPI00214E93BD|nr:uncharacterized protein LOC126380973 [Pectinophora gossypiella]